MHETMATKNRQRTHQHVHCGAKRSAHDISFLPVSVVENMQDGRVLSEVLPQRSQAPVLRMHAAFRAFAQALEDARNLLGEAFVVSSQNAGSNCGDISSFNTPQKQKVGTFHHRNGFISKLLWYPPCGHHGDSTITRGKEVATQLSTFKAFISQQI